MTEQNMSATRTVAEAVSMAPRSGPMGFGMGPVFAAGVAAAVLIPGLTFGAVATANTLSAQGEQGSEQPGASGTGDENDEPGTGSGSDEDPDSGSDPHSDPDRGSDPGDEDDPEGSSETPDGDDAEADSEGDGYIDQDVVHIVQPGDTLSGISGQYGVPMEVIAEHNGIEDYNVIYIDAAILIPYSEVNVPVDWDQ